jgi:hypothetical protein
MGVGGCDGVMTADATGYRVQGAGYRVQGAGCRVQGTHRVVLSTAA